jgi:hypothetical protein
MLIPLVVTSEGGVCQKLKIVFDLDFILSTSVDNLFEESSPVRGIDA